MVEKFDVTRPFFTPVAKSSGRQMDSFTTGGLPHRRPADGSVYSSAESRKSPADDQDGPFVLLICRRVGAQGDHPVSEMRQNWILRLLVQADISPLLC